MPAAHADPSLLLCFDPATSSHTASDGSSQQVYPHRPAGGQRRIRHAQDEGDPAIGRRHRDPRQWCGLRRPWRRGERAHRRRPLPAGQRRVLRPRATAVGRLRRPRRLERARSRPQRPYRRAWGRGGDCLGARPRVQRLGRVLLSGHSRLLGSLRLTQARQVDACVSGVGRRAVALALPGWSGRVRWGWGWPHKRSHRRVGSCGVARALTDGASAAEGGSVVKQ